MTGSQKRKIVIVIVLLISACAAGGILRVLPIDYVSSDFDIAPVGDELIEPPQYLFSFADAGGHAHAAPDRRVRRQETRSSSSTPCATRIDVFDLDGEFIRSFGGDETVVPLYIAQNPLDDNIYVSDRRARTIHIFTPEGEYVGEFDPKLPEDELPTFETRAIQWAPVALAFGEDGTLYVTEILNGHRLLIFEPDGEFEKSVGTAGHRRPIAEENPELFQFPNSVKVHDDDGLCRRQQQPARQGLRCSRASTSASS